MQTAYTISEAMGSVSVCVDISSAQLARNVSVTLRSVTGGAAVGKPFESYNHNACVPDAMYLQILQQIIINSDVLSASSDFDKGLSPLFVNQYCYYKALDVLLLVMYVIIQCNLG